MFFEGSLRSSWLLTMPEFFYGHSLWAGAAATVAQFIVAFGLAKRVGAPPPVARPKGFA
jgi:hypothetical protein